MQVTRCRVETLQNAGCVPVVTLSLVIVLPLIAVKEFDLAKRLNTHKALLDRAYNRLTLDQLREMDLAATLPDPKTMAVSLVSWHLRVFTPDNFCGKCPRRCMNYRYRLNLSWCPF